MVVWVTARQGLDGVLKTAKITSMVVGRIGEMTKKEERLFSHRTLFKLLSHR